MICQMKLREASSFLFSKRSGQTNSQVAIDCPVHYGDPRNHLVRIILLCSLDLHNNLRFPARFIASAPRTTGTEDKSEPRKRSARRIAAKQLALAVQLAPPGGRSPGRLCAVRGCPSFARPGFFAGFPSSAARHATTGSGSRLVAPAPHGQRKRTGAKLGSEAAVFIDLAARRGGVVSRFRSRFLPVSTRAARQYLVVGGLVLACSGRKKRLPGYQPFVTARVIAVAAVATLCACMVL